MNNPHTAPARPSQAQAHAANPILFAAALFGCSSIALGAFGAHALKHLLSADSLATWQTGVQYHSYHSLALLMLGLNGHRAASRKGSAYCWALGIMLFSGSLYALALGAPPKLGLLTPLGGLLFMLGWLWLAVPPRNTAT